MNDSALNFIRVAERDVLASKALYRNKAFPQSFFYFQQAAEKANKALGLITNAISENELKNIKHLSFNIQRKPIAKQEKIAIELQEVYNKYPEIESFPPFSNLNALEYNKSIKKALSLHDKLQNSNLKNISLFDLEKLLSDISEVNKLKFVMPPGFKEKFRSDMSKFAEGMIGMGKMTENEKAQMHAEMSDDKLIDSIEKRFIKNIQKTSRFAKTYYVIGACVVITMQHSSSTRYPESGDPSKIYRITNPLIMMQPKFLRLLGDAIQDLKILRKYLTSPQNSIKK